MRSIQSGLKKEQLGFIFSRSSTKNTDVVLSLD